MQKLSWWGEAPERLYDFVGGAGLYWPTPGYAYALADLSDEAFHTVTQCPFFEA
jgi:hypothetical protein